MFKNLINKIKTFFEKDEDKSYMVTNCEQMPSLVGMRVVGKPVLNKKSIFLGKNKVFRTLIPIKIKPTEQGLELYTEHLIATLKEIK